MTSKSRKPSIGRPTLPAAERAVRRISVRLYAEDEQLLDELCTQLECGESEAIRAALRLLGRHQRIRAR